MATGWAHDGSHWYRMSDFRLYADLAGRKSVANGISSRTQAPWLKAGQSIRNLVLPQPRLWHHEDWLAQPERNLVLP